MVMMNRIRKPSECEAQHRLWNDYRTHNHLKPHITSLAMRLPCDQYGNSPTTLLSHVLLLNSKESSMLMVCNVSYGYVIPSAGKPSTWLPVSPEGHNWWGKLWPWSVSKCNKQPGRSLFSTDIKLSLMFLRMSDQVGGHPSGHVYGGSP